ncbi:MAG: hypothetical protein BGO88_07125 [Flavobacterium sp. 38-13]|uniref:hypothetical protein n=1 Tax=Flavobacterium sp. 38-13 TaxID=1896168 RepID=UPI000967C9AA|nr:hypothetical protein [Flavobacterium sp. 38-13]OJX50961.1 MAG: hypothetical protein BGO88_07125 [Flavobacterium sp. 38-13]
MVKEEAAIAFKFVKYRISDFIYHETKKEKSEYDISFFPKGEYDESSGLYILNLAFRAHDKENAEHLAIQVEGIAEYQFDKNYKLEEIPSHFFLSAVPIFFPYLRAFISTLTLQTNSTPIILGLMNFTKMAEPLKKNTVKK